MTSRSSASNPTTQPVVTVSASAKVNLILRILDRRSDGYHNLWSIMQTVALEDEIRISLAPRTGEIRLRCDAQDLAVDRSNLVYKATTAVLDKAQRPIGLDIELSKRIPMGAGLGGGSSDAAATFFGLNRLLKLGWSQAQMAEVGQPLGSDVPFFLFAPTAIVAGRGEVVRPVHIDGTRWAVLVNPGVGVETKWAYHELAATRGVVQQLAGAHRELDQHGHMNWRQLTAAAENDFEAPVFAKHGALREIKQDLLNMGAEMALLSGSGATVFGLFQEEATARKTQTHFAGQQSFKVFVVPTCSSPLAVR